MATSIQWGVGGGVGGGGGGDIYFLRKTLFSLYMYICIEGPLTVVMGITVYRCL